MRIELGVHYIRAAVGSSVVSLHLIPHALSKTTDEPTAAAYLARWTLRTSGVGTISLSAWGIKRREVVPTFGVSASLLAWQDIGRGDDLTERMGY